jgi:hypothetical protein
MQSSDEVVEPETVPVVRRSERRNFGVPADRFSPEPFQVRLAHDISEPTSYKEAMNSEQSDKWKSAMNDEMYSLVNNGTWKLVELPSGRVPIGSKWVYKIKEDAKGSITRFKARLVGQGYTQKYGVDFDEVFAPVVNQVTLRVLITYAGQNGLKLKHFDIATAFLNGDLNEDIYMRQPTGYIVEGSEHLVCKLEKSIYGLKQSARMWNKKIDTTLKNCGFAVSSFDPCLYQRTVNSKPMFLLVYVDDILVAFDDETEIDRVYQSLAANFQMTDLGDVKLFLGVEVEHREDGLYSICQSGYIRKTLTRFGMDQAKG